MHSARHLGTLFSITLSLQDFTELFCILPNKFVFLCLFSHEGSSNSATFCNSLSAFYALLIELLLKTVKYTAIVWLFKSNSLGPSLCYLYVTLDQQFNFLWGNWFPLSQNRCITYLIQLWELSEVIPIKNMHNAWHIDKNSINREQFLSTPVRL